METLCVIVGISVCCVCMIVSVCLQSRSPQSAGQAMHTQTLCRAFHALLSSTPRSPCIPLPSTQPPGRPPARLADRPPSRPPARLPGLLPARPAAVVPPAGRRARPSARPAGFCTIQLSVLYYVFRFAQYSSVCCITFFVSHNTAQCAVLRFSFRTIQLSVLYFFGRSPRTIQLSVLYYVFGCAQYSSVCCITFFAAHNTAQCAVLRFPLRTIQLSVLYCVFARVPLARPLSGLNWPESPWQGCRRGEVCAPGRARKRKSSPPKYCRKQARSDPFVVAGSCP